MPSFEPRSVPTRGHAPTGAYRDGAHNSARDHLAPVRQEQLEPIEVGPRGRQRTGTAERLMATGAELEAARRSSPIPSAGAARRTSTCNCARDSSSANGLSRHSSAPASRPAAQPASASGAVIISTGVRSPARRSATDLDAVGAGQQQIEAHRVRRTTCERRPRPRADSPTPGDHHLKAVAAQHPIEPLPARSSTTTSTRTRKIVSPRSKSALRASPVGARRRLSGSQSSRAAASRCPNPESTPARQGAARPSPTTRRTAAPAE
jgi:hypothetical protein